jgi:hypothetical protein
VELAPPQKSRPIVLDGSMTKMSPTSGDQPPIRGDGMGIERRRHGHYRSFSFDCGDEYGTHWAETSSGSAGRPGDGYLDLVFS